MRVDISYAWCDEVAWVEVTCQDVDATANDQPLVWPWHELTREKKERTRGEKKKNKRTRTRLNQNRSIDKHTLQHQHTHTRMQTAMADMAHRQ